MATSVKASEFPMNQFEIDNGLESGSIRGWPVTRPEIASILILMLIALVLRAWRPAHMAVEHFDEGVYASNLFSDELVNPQAPYSYPDRHLYAPPLLPAVLESALLLGGSSGSVMWANVLIGTLTVLAVWWVGRTWFGPVSAIIAATLVATSEYHIAFSRTALTDPLLCLWMIVAVYAGWNAVLSRRLLWIAVAGVSAGLAWCTKYNGWLTLAITGSGSIAWLAVSRQPLKTVAGVMLAWFGTVAIATGCFCFVVLGDLADQGGYAAVSANHARYFVGASGWWDSFLHQVASHRRLDGWISLGGVVSAVLMGSILYVRRFTWNGYWNAPKSLVLAVVIAGPLILILSGLILCSSLLLALAGLVGLAMAIRAPDRVAMALESLPQLPQSVSEPSTAESPPASQDLQNRGARLAGWMTAAWFFGLLVAVPLYHPYPRLSLPWLLSCWLAAAGMFSGFVRSPMAVHDGNQSGKHNRAGLIATAVVLVCAAAATAVWRGVPFVPARSAAWEDRAAFTRIARRILADAEWTVSELPASRYPDVDAVFYIYGEPAIFFHLEALAEESSLQFIAQPAGNLGATGPGATDPGVSTFLITGMHAEADREALDQATRSLPLVATYPYAPSLLVRLDDTQAADEQGESVQVQLFLLHPPGEG